MAKEYDFKLFVASKPNVWLNPYSISKEACEKYSMTYHQEYKTKVAILKYFSVYGPYQYVYKYNKAVPYFTHCALNNQPLVVYGTGEQEADFLYVADVVKAADWILENNIWGIPIEYSQGVGIKVNYLAKKIIQLTKSESKVIFVPMRIGEPENAKIYADTKVMRKIIKIRPETSLEEGLIKTIEFYKKYYVNLKY